MRLTEKYREIGALAIAPRGRFAETATIEGTKFTCADSLLVCVLHGLKVDMRAVDRLFGN
jgi:hypothetical protein